MQTEQRTQQNQQQLEARSMREGVRRTSLRKPRAHGFAELPIRAGGAGRPGTPQRGLPCPFGASLPTGNESPQT